MSPPADVQNGRNERVCHVTPAGRCQRPSIQSGLLDAINPPHIIYVTIQPHWLVAAKQRSAADDWLYADR